MRNFGMQCFRIAFLDEEAARSDANYNYSLFTIHYSLISQGGA
jgi:hypothetical protein